MAEGYKIVLEESANPNDLQAVEHGLLAYNLQFVPDPHFKRLTVFTRDKAGVVIGGCLGETYWGWLHVSILWLAESQRGHGLGKQMLLMAEIEASHRGCHHAHLDTLDFQSLPFYQKLGYTLFGVLDDHPTGHKRYFLQKALDPTDA